MTEAERFFHRFDGLSRAHGRYDLSGNVTENGKKLGHAHTVREPPTIALWEKHLAGEKGIGIVPIRDDATVSFGAIDIDQYKGLDIKKLAAELEKMELPLILCRSKSGGAQLYIFTREPITAELVRGKLMEWAVALGYSGVEVFPKQIRLAGENDFGNWINMPYFDAKKTDRYAVYANKKLNSTAFLDLADMLAVDTRTLTEIKIASSPEMEEWWEDAPPCLQTLAKKGFEEGARNNALFDIGVYLRKRFGDDFWEEKLDKYNQKFLRPPLGHKEVTQVARSLKRKAYEYKCTDMPISAVCNRQICLTRKHGIGNSDGDPGVVFGTLIKLQTEPPTWIWDVNGARLELATSEIKDQNRFHSRCIEELNIWPLTVKPRQWAELVRDKLQSVETIEVPPDATPEGQMMAHLYNYCTSRAKARNREEILQNKPWTQHGRTFFNSLAFKNYLEQNRMRVTERQLWTWLRRHGASHKFMNIKGRGVNLWSVPAFEEQKEDYEIPTIDDLEEM